MLADLLTDWRYLTICAFAGVAIRAITYHERMLVSVWLTAVSLSLATILWALITMGVRTALILIFPLGL